MRTEDSVMSEKYIFIHIPKTGGDSIEKFLRDKVIPTNMRMLRQSYVQDAMITFRKYGVGTNQWQHCRWKDLTKEVKESGRKFVTVVRNPWAKAVSQYKFAHKLVKEHGMTNVTSLHPDATFEDFLETRHKFGNELYFWQRTTVGWYNQKDYVCNSKDQLKVDILRFENYDEDTMKYFDLDKPIAKRNVTESKSYDYKDLYNDKSIQVIADWYKDDIEYFGFDFETGASKNYWNM